MRLSRPVRRVLFLLHQMLGLSVGLLLLVSGLTGAVLAFREPLDRWLEPGIHVVRPRAAAASLDACLAAVAARPGVEVSAVDLPRRPDGPLHLWLRPAGEALVDPYTARVLAVRGDEESFTGWVFHLHTELLAGRRGEVLLGTAALLVPLLALSGLLLAWPRRGQWRQALSIRRRRGLKAANFDLHRSLGLVSAAFFTALAATGASLQFGESLEKLLGGFAAPPRVAARQDRLPYDALLAIARAAVPGGRPTRLYLPREATDPVLLRFRMAGEYHPNGRSQVFCDPSSGAVLRVDDATRAGWWRRLVYERYPLHIGSYAGWASRLLHALFGLAVALLGISGMVMLLLRRGRRGQAR